MFIKKPEPPIVISVGGSLIVPNGGVDSVFLSKLNKLIRSEVIKGRRFILIAGGGNIARHYRDSGKKVIGTLSDEDLDWLGIHATRLNAHLLRTIFQDIANPRIVINYEKKIANWIEPVAIGAGWKPGWSTDYDAVILARDYKANVIINLSNIDVVYDKDPKKFKDAKPIERITWADMEKLTGDKWSPGLNIPFDPIATQLAKQIGITAIITSGHDIKNLQDIIEGEPFKGTVVMPFRIDSSFYDRDYYSGRKSGNRINRIDSVIGKSIHNILNFMRALMTKIRYNPKKCLDIGCGNGILVKWLRFFGVDAYGIDFSPFALEMADPGVKRYIKLGDITKIPYSNDSFDHVITIDLLQKLERSKIKKAIKETIRVSNKYIVHKIQTKENAWFDIFHGPDYSNLSLFYKNYWEKLFSSMEEIMIKKISFNMPVFFETKFLLKKKATKK
ncbi:MAG: Aspartate/glutamate/uridylate kinase [Candidatus Roizmanbacteria bacterium GW2011_GWA2_35_19]|uniref:UMP kinase n=2 Tax=Candidatus Roizmaniibacteriota TaxID=1752723 RepID=A0A0G0BTS7_9BACT|nr:MAG: Aspartate/glutamate/uridylate kinase [Candidatus Roizmanbacteria bacterium GW2011_GWA2_35_19]